MLCSVTTAGMQMDSCSTMRFLDLDSAFKRAMSSGSVMVVICSSSSSPEPLQHKQDLLSSAYLQRMHGQLEATCKLQAWRSCKCRVSGQTLAGLFSKHTCRGQQM